MVPEGWIYKRLELVAELQRGFDLPSSLRIDGKIPIVSSGGISGFHHEARAKAPGIVTGRYGSIGEVYFLEQDYWPLNTSLWVKNFHGNDEKFIFFLLRKFDFKKFSDKTGVPGINRNDLHQVKVRVPPLHEQKKIAEILTAWDKAISITEQLLVNSQQQKKVLMQQLMTGRKRTAGGLSNKMSIRDGFSKKKLGMLPNDWKVEKIKNHLWYQEGPGVRNHQFTESGVKLFNGTNIQFNRVTLTSTTTHISEEEAFGPYKHFLVESGDLLIACSGISVDRFDEKIAFIGDDQLPLCMNTSTMRFKTLDPEKVDINYFNYFMKSTLFKNQIRRQVTGSAQLNFGPSHVGVCYVVLPPIDEQRAIASILVSADKETDLLKRNLDYLHQEKNALMQQLLTGKRRVKTESDV